ELVRTGQLTDAEGREGTVVRLAPQVEALAGDRADGVAALCENGPQLGGVVSARETPAHADDGDGVVVRTRLSDATVRACVMGTTGVTAWLGADPQPAGRAQLVLRRCGFRRSGPGDGRTGAAVAVERGQELLVLGGEIVPQFS